MSTIRLSCGRCATHLDLAPDRVVVAVPVQQTQRRACELLLTCIRCGSTGVQHVPHAVAAALVTYGAGCLPALDLHDFVAEHPERRPEVTTPLSLDDVLSLHELLQTADWFEVLDPGDEAPRA